MFIKIFIGFILFLACDNAVFAQDKRLKKTSPQHTSEAEKKRLEKLKEENSRKEAEANQKIEPPYNCRIGIISLAQTIAEKSHKVEDIAIRALLAKEAYELNKAVEGDLYDSYICEAVYAAIEKLKPNFNLMPSIREVKNLSPIEALKNPKALIAKSPTAALISTTDSKYLYSCNGTNILRWENKYPTQSPTIAYQSRNESVSNMLIIDKKLLVRATVKGEIEVFKMGKGGLILDAVIKTHNGTAVTNMVILGKNIISAGADGNLFYTQIDKKKSYLLADEVGFEKGLLGIAISPDGKYLFCVFPNTNQLHLMNLEKDAAHEETLNDAFSTKEIDGDSLQITAFAQSPNGMYLAIGYSNGAIRIWNFKEPDFLTKKPELIQFHKQQINDLVFSNNSQQLAVAGQDSVVSLWQIELDSPNESHYGEYPNNPYKNPSYVPIRFRNLSTASSSVVFSSDNSRLFVGTQKGEMQIFETDMSIYATQICELVGKNLGDKVWQKYVGISPEEILKIYDACFKALQMEKRNLSNTCGEGKPTID